MSAAFATAQISVQPGVAMSDLTVPPERLPAGCALPQAPVMRLGDNKMQSGLWAGLPITSNPWVGSDRAIVAAIIESMDRPTLVPDAPLTPRDAARFRLQLADGVDEAYAAVYGKPRRRSSSSTRSASPVRWRQS
jgi:hypothetical protein